MGSKIRFAAFFLLFLSVSIALAHGEGSVPLSSNWTALGLIDPVDVIFVTIIISGLSFFFAVIFKGKLSESHKKILFVIIAIPIAFATLYLGGTTVYLNIVSGTGGPVHWHADYQIWDCGKQLDLVSPEGISNRIGTPLIHEHGDNRIHIEGVLLNKDYASLDAFFEVVGGFLSDTNLTVPTDNGVVSVTDGDLCNGKPGKVQVFVYKIKNGFDSQKNNFKYDQFKADSEYVMSPFSNVPPGDCIIIEFDKEKNTTDKICDTYSIAIENGDMEIA